VAKKLPKPKVSEQLVEKFWDLYSRLGSYSGAWRELHSWSLLGGAARGLGSPGQGWNSASGKAFEIISQHIIIDQIKVSHLSSTVQVTPWGDTPSHIREGILSEMVWPKGQISHPERAESNVDVIATLRQDHEPIRVISVYSCKSSTAERYQQDFYWAEKLKARGIRFCFVTIEESLVKYATGSTIPARSNKTVVLSQALYDRIYLLTEKDVIQNTSVFRPIDSVVKDLDLWIQAY
jgi:hypothetical protein